MKKLILATIIGAGALAAAATTASAEIVCNRDGDCWHVREHYDYQPTFGLIIHDDNWRWGDRDHYRWHEHDGRGYWKGGVWIQF
ncbi:MAG TPA: hypothetical protein VN723_16000 [Rhizomicrobium sp.]|nr:hypothetical protein [Rhizomicrobium sp.]